MVLHNCWAFSVSCSYYKYKDKQILTLQGTLIIIKAFITTSNTDFTSYFRANIIYICGTVDKSRTEHDILHTSFLVTIIINQRLPGYYQLDFIF